MSPDQPDERPLTPERKNRAYPRIRWIYGVREILITYNTMACQATHHALNNHKH